MLLVTARLQRVPGGGASCPSRRWRGANYLVSLCVAPSRVPGGGQRARGDLIVLPVISSLTEPFSVWCSAIGRRGSENTIQCRPAVTLRGCAGSPFLPQGCRFRFQVPGSIILAGSRSTQPGRHLPLISSVGGGWGRGQCRAGVTKQEITSLLLTTCSESSGRESRQRRDELRYAATLRRIKLRIARRPHPPHIYCTYTRNSSTRREEDEGEMLNVRASLRDLLADDTLPGSVAAAVLVAMAVSLKEEEGEEEQR
ncbi:hypothetical protein O3P69_007710 [Scylla paramamosain]|uniref:Uncharacterized protein n=1 Tax=Scylla paramamosain TaxID=85552 RepID=A0AAW0V198_SCYPA